MAQQTNKKDQYGLFSIFPMFVYRGRLQTHARWKEHLVPVLQQRYENVNGSNSNTLAAGGKACWNCDCYTSFFEESMVDHTKEEEIEVAALLQDLSQNIQEAIKAAEFYPHAFLVAQQWFNAYGPNQNQEEHNHIPSHLSGVYYVKYDPQFHKSTTFINPLKMYTEGPRFNKHYFDPDMCGYGCYKEEMTLSIEEGDVVIFPAQMGHMVHRQPGIEKNPNGELYMSFSFNVELVSENEATERLGDGPQGQGGQGQPPGNPNMPILPNQGQSGAPQGGPPPQGGQGGGPEGSQEWSSDWF